jgi:probable F420-dependent oxidoreductase
MIRFAVSAFLSSDAGEWRDFAQQCEEQGFSALAVPDHVGIFDPFVALSTAGAATSTLQLITYVINAEFWNPLLLARAAMTTSVLSDGRLVLGLGAGHAEEEFIKAGIAYNPPVQRVARLARVVPALRALLDGESVTDEILGLDDASTGFGAPARIPLLIGGNGDTVLRLAAHYGDVAGLVGFTSGTGQRHSNLSHWSWEGLAERADYVRRHTHGRTPPAFNVLVQAVEVTNDRRAAAEVLAERTAVAPEVHLESPFVLIGDDTEIAAQLERLDQLLGGCTLSVFSPYAEAIAPFIH